ISADGQGFCTVPYRNTRLHFWHVDRPAPVRVVNVGKVINAHAISANFHWAIANSGDSANVYLLNLRTCRVVARSDLRALGDHEISTDGRFAVISSIQPSAVFLFELPQ